ncbi:MAG: FAD/NAD(P)-binding protein [Gammaproteobacteria bacterium]|nr:FAD/NAD(P)-binding protein [Gammaproteobacteria bacterium]
MRTEPWESPHTPQEAEIVERLDESDTVFTLKLRFTDTARHDAYDFEPGQYNMLYLYGVGEVPISIVSDPEHDDLLDHTIRRVGRVTEGIAALRPGDRLGVRGPYGRGWPLRALEGKDVLVVTGGLGCAPSVSVIQYMMRRRARFGAVTILQGVKHYNDLLWRQRYEEWACVPRTRVLFSADVGGPIWPWHVGPVTGLFEHIEIDPQHTLALLCGPEGMMAATVKALRKRGLADSSIWLSLERSMHCAVGQCGHCQLGGKFVCKDGPVFRHDEIEPLFSVKGL